MTTVIAPRYAVHMDAQQETSRARGSGKRQPARERIVRSAAALVRERGVHGVGLRQIVARADGPRGSLQRYFPGGKTQLITEALNLAGAEVLHDTQSGLSEAATVADAIDAIFAPWRRVLLESNYTISGATRYTPPWSNSASRSQPQRTMPPYSSQRSRAPSS